jgi:methyl-accepting chemotaxis protein
MLFSKRAQVEKPVTVDMTAYEALRERSELLDTTCGIGLWEAVLFQGDAMHPQSLWKWSSEFRRLIGYNSEAEFPNIVQSWSDRLHPDDVASTFAAFGGHLVDKTGGSRYDVIYRLKVRDGSYRWFRATGGCRYSADGTTVRCCGSLTDIQDQKAMEFQSEHDASQDHIIIQVLGDALKQLAAGNVAYRIEADIAPKAIGLKQDFNDSLAALADTIGSMKTTLATVQQIASETSLGAGNLSQRTEQQASALEETAATTEELAASVKATADSSRHALDTGHEAMKAAEQGGLIAGKAVEAMSRIEAASHKISDIIRVIDDIAFQTNLLALNAAVEAARAGDAGRGFAVVASEVRTLAQRSSAAAKDIATLIASSNDEVRGGVKLVGDAGSQLDLILSFSRKLAGNIAEISQAANEQAKGIEEMSQAVAHLDEMTQHNAGLADQSTAAATTLTRQIDALGTLVQVFRTEAPMYKDDGMAARASTRRAA